MKSGIIYPEFTSVPTIWVKRKGIAAVVKAGSGCTAVTAAAVVLEPENRVPKVVCARGLIVCTRRACAHAVRRRRNRGRCTARRRGCSACPLAGADCSACGWACGWAWAWACARGDHALLHLVWPSRLQHARQLHELRGGHASALPLVRSHHTQRCLHVPGLHEHR